MNKEALRFTQNIKERYVFHAHVMYGSVLNLEIGNPILVIDEHPYKNRPLVYIRGEYIIQLEMCDWEIFELNKAIITSKQYKDNLKMIRTINRLLQANQVDGIEVNHNNITILLHDNIEIRSTPYHDSSTSDPMIRLMEGEKEILLTCESA